MEAKWDAVAEARSRPSCSRQRQEVSDRSISRLLRAIAGMRAVTLEGHHARAAAFVVWDEGDLLGRAAVDHVLSDEFLAAVVVDLLTLSGAEGSSDRLKAGLPTRAAASR